MKYEVKRQLSADETIIIVIIQIIVLHDLTKNFENNSNVIITII